METMSRIEVIQSEACLIVEIAEGSGVNFAWKLGEGVEEAVKSGEYSTYEIGVLIERLAESYVALNQWRVNNGMKKI